MTEWLEKEKVKVLKWPSQSLDLNPIENLWEALKRKVSGHNVRNKGQFLEILKETWESISPEIIKTLIGSMPRRLREVIKNKGYATHYTDSQKENFFFLHEQISNFLKGHDLLVTNRPKKNFPRV